MQRLTMRNLSVLLLLTESISGLSLTAREQIYYRSLNTDVDIVGALGVPIGTVTEIEATIVAGRTLGTKFYQGSYLLKVAKVGSDPLTDQPISPFFSHSWDRVDLPRNRFELYELKTGRKTGTLTSEDIEQVERDYVGRSYRLLVYELGGFSGVPGGLPRDYPVWQDDRGYGFHTQLVVLRILEQPSEHERTGSQAQPPKQKEPDVHGAASAGSITVRIVGEGVKRPGLFHVAPGTQLREVIAQAEPSVRSNGWFLVFRQVDGRDRILGFRLEREKSPPLPDFELQDGDHVSTAAHEP
jgi:hypothetical protein